MCPVPPAVNQTPCHVRHVRWSFPALPCPRCGRGAPRTDEAARIAIDIDLEAPVLLQIDVDGIAAPPAAATSGRSRRSCGPTPSTPTGS